MDVALKSSATARLRKRPPVATAPNGKIEAQTPVRSLRKRRALPFALLLPNKSSRRSLRKIGPMQVFLGNLRYGQRPSNPKCRIVVANTTGCFRLEGSRNEV